MSLVPLRFCVGALSRMVQLLAAAAALPLASSVPIVSVLGRLPWRGVHRLAGLSGVRQPRGSPEISEGALNDVDRHLIAH
ncbi:MAG: hypothetical protein QF733_05675 [Phycisphaerales bacterium]|nr:hypothetical protein [Phycisphaerales bacterium]